MRFEIASDLGGLRCEFFSKTIKFHTFLYAYGSTRYFPPLILDADVNGVRSPNDQIT